jgi:hypothetical protein
MTPDDVRELIENSENLTTTYLGTHESRMGVEEKIGIPDQHRNTHILSIGATGTGQINELFEQLTGHGHVQVEDARRGLAHNVGGSGGGVTVAVLEKEVNA